ncbi:MAG: NADH-quinone oxidoreductase subunit N [Candidatus Kapaibacterium sp.]
MFAIDQTFLNELTKSISLFKPEFALVATFIVAIVADLIFRSSRNIAGIIALVGFVVTGIFLADQATEGTFVFERMLAVDSFATFFKFIVLISSFIVVIMSFFSDELYAENRKLGEYFTIIVGMTFGMFLLSGATNLIMIYLAIEMMSISSYILAGYTKEIRRAGEASLKYVIYGAVSSGVMIYGISILYGLTGTLNLAEINVFLANNNPSIYALMVSVLMILAGFGYKISAVPFHFWTPDVYEGAPVTITAYLSVASKAAGFAVLIRFMKAGFIDLSMSGQSVWSDLGGIDWMTVIAILAVLTMTLGNLVAVWQNNVKRMLAYSSIAHAGYMLMAVAAMTDTGILAVEVYFFVYLFMNLGAFFVVMLIANKIGSEELEDYTGLGYRAPILGVAMTIFMISLTGLPPTAGFIGKLYVFTAVLEADMIWLAVVGVLNSVVSLFYYVKVLRNMWVRGVDVERPALSYSSPAKIILMLLVIPTLLFGIYFTPILQWAERSVGIYLGNYASLFGV